MKYFYLCRRYDARCKVEALQPSPHLSIDQCLSRFNHRIAQIEFENHTFKHEQQKLKEDQRQLKDLLQRQINCCFSRQQWLFEPWCWLLTRFFLFLFADRVSLSCPVWLALKKRFYWHFTRSILPSSINIESFVLLSQKKCQQSNEELSDNDDPFEKATIDRFLARDDRLANEFQQRNHRSLISSRLNSSRRHRLSDGFEYEEKGVEMSRWRDQVKHAIDDMYSILLRLSCFDSRPDGSHLDWSLPRTADLER